MSLFKADAISNGKALSNSTGTVWILLLHCANQYG
ncbi:hypothetical protein [Alishewanella longhuensis]